jgi:membrane-associated phospholipid phosphatase
MYDTAIDVISISTSLLFIAPIVIYIFYRSNALLTLAVGSLVAATTAELIKKYITVDMPAFKRPKGARACDILSRCGSVEHESGMPSAHASSTAFAATYIVLTCQNSIIKVSAILYWLAVCYSRYKKNCHSPAQLVVGSVLGATLGFLATRVSPY